MMKRACRERALFFISHNAKAYRAGLLGYVELNEGVDDFVIFKEHNGAPV